jgi:hypothetical protein
MPAKFYAASEISPTFGLEAETAVGFLVESLSYDVSADKAEVFDESGELVYSHRYNKKASISISGIGTTSMQVGGILSSLANTVGSPLDGTILVDSVTKTSTSSDFQKTQIAATQYDQALSLATS